MVTARVTASMAMERGQGWGEDRELRVMGRERSIGSLTQNDNREICA